MRGRRRPPGISPEGVRRQEQQGRILGRAAGSDHRYPMWQVTAAGRPLPGVPDLFERPGGLPWTGYPFLLQHPPELDGATALEALQRGAHARVVAAAENATGGVS